MTLLAVALTTAPALAPAQTPIGTLGERDGVTIRGKVADVFGNEFVLDDGTGRVLVETGPEWHRRVAVERGETLTVTGEADDDEFEAWRIERASGEVIKIRDPEGPPPWAGGRRDRDDDDDDRRGAADIEAGRAALADLGLSDVRFEEADGRHLEFRAETASGVAIEATTERDGRLRDIEVEDDRDAARADLARLLPEDARRLAAAEGVVAVEEIEHRGRRIEIEGRDRAGRKVELAFDAAGTRLIEREGARAPALPDTATIRARLEAAGYAWQGETARGADRVEVRASNPHGQDVLLDIAPDGAVVRERAIR